MGHGDPPPKLYAVLTAACDIKRRGRAQGSGPMVYTEFETAKRQARADGDCVVEIQIDAWREPLFIRKRVVK